ncbi:putative ATPase [Streptomyces achromogenes]|uniref:ATPase n=1 Tax=Streptomyces achromogenes TaxID=67255 RepID=A0ABU0Q3N3_STRAH|nr:AAA family ATPase [Streptomyces achromogenes]MDQ0685280.1 putative ATPase [Streptomyces achromogenes]
MELRHVSIENFRAFSRAEWDLPATGLILVAGANNSGKSSLLSSLDVIAGTMGYEPGLGYRNARSAAEPVVKATFVMADARRRRMLSMLRGVPQRVIDSDRAFKEVEFIFRKGTDAGFSVAEIRASWATSEKVSVARIERQKSGEHALFALAPDQSGTPDGEISLSQRWSAHQDGQTVESLRWQLGEANEFFRELESWRSRYYHFKALRSGPPRSSGLTSEPRLDPTGSNLPAVLLDLQTNRSQLMDELRKTISQMVPEVGRLETPTLNNVLEVAFSDPFTPGFRHNLKELGTGVEQLLLTLVVGLTEETPSTLVVEEPETNLHPAAQRALLGLLNSWADDRLIIAATHSPVMLDWAPGEKALWHITRSEGDSHLTAVEESPVHLFQSLGVRISDVLSADRLLFVEGPSDEDILSVWFPEVMRNPRISLISGGGGDNARLADRFSQWLRHADRLGLRRVLYLRDRDELPPEEVTALTQSGSVYVIDCREVENFLLDSEAIASTISRDSQLRVEVDSALVREQIVNAAQGLRQSMIVNRVARRISSVRLMDHKMRGKLARNATTAEEIWEAVNSRLPEPVGLRRDIEAGWELAAREVSNMSNDQLIKWAPGEEILNAVYLHFLGRRFKKRVDGKELALEIGEPPTELRAVLRDFMSE